MRFMKPKTICAVVVALALSSCAAPQTKQETQSPRFRGLVPWAVSGFENRYGQLDPPPRHRINPEYVSIPLVEIDLY